MAWDAWGVPEQRRTLSESATTLLRQVLGVSAPHTDGLARDQVRLAPIHLAAQHLDELAGIVGAEHAATDDEARLLRAGGKSTLDLLRRQSPQPQDAPDAVVRPADHDEVEQVVRYCAAHRIAVVPFGGGTSVVGGLDPVRDGFAGVIALDLIRLAGLLEVDHTSGTATLLAGTSGPQAEQLLNAHGVSLGHFPQSFLHASIGGFAATRSSGQNSAGYGRFDDMVERLTVVTPEGTLRLGRAPASAAGPDLRELFVGSEGTLGVITDVTVRVHPVPEASSHEAWSFDSFAQGAAALRSVIQSGLTPTVMRLSDEAETGLNLAMAEKVGDGPATSGCLSVTKFEGTTQQVAARSAVAASLLAAAGGRSLGAAPAQDWEHGRFTGPYLRDALMRVGAIAETLETATTWANLSNLRTAVTEALTTTLAGQGTPPLVLCHISHTYPSGAALYFTVVCAAAADPTTQWRAAKKAASDAIMRSGATITHHHAVGRDHRPWMTEEIGDLGAKILRAVKETVDPAGVLNPGKLIPS